MDFLIELDVNLYSDHIQAKSQRCLSIVRQINNSHNCSINISTDNFFVSLYSILNIYIYIYGSWNSSCYPIPESYFVANYSLLRKLSTKKYFFNSHLIGQEYNNKISREFCPFRLYHMQISVSLIPSIYIVYILEPHVIQ